MYQINRKDRDHEAHTEDLEARARRVRGSWNAVALWDQFSYSEDEDLDGYSTWRVQMKDGVRYDIGCITLVNGEYLASTDKDRDMVSATLEAAVFAVIVSYTGIK